MAINLERFVKAKRFTEDHILDDASDQILIKTDAGSSVGDAIAAAATPDATDTIKGKVALNAGTDLPGDATNCTDALTACGLNALLADTTAGGNAVINGIKALIPASATVPDATDTIKGIAALNSGNTLPGDATNCTDALTACGLNAILADTTAGGNAVINGIKALTDGSETKVTAGTNVTITGTGTTASPYVVNATGGGGSVVDASGTQSGIVNLVSMQVLGAGDKVINGARIGRGAGNISSNTVVGNGALNSNTTGVENTANGSNSMNSNTGGAYNTACGVNSLRANTTGNFNTAMGGNALYSSTSGTSNTAIGINTLYSCTTGVENTAVGVFALRNNDIGSYNTAFGIRSLQNNTSGSHNSAFGIDSLNYNTTGAGNTAFGLAALYNNTTGSFNTVIGGQHSSIGVYAPVFDITTQNNRVAVAHTGVTNAYIQVAWTVVSDERDKTDFAEVPHGLDFVSKLKPTAYRYKPNREATEGHGPLRYGFKAQDILATELEYGVAPVIVDAENEEKLYLNDSNLIAVLVNAIKELKAEVDALKANQAA